MIVIFVIVDGWLLFLLLLIGDCQCWAHRGGHPEGARPFQGCQTVFNQAVIFFISKWIDVFAWTLEYGLLGEADKGALPDYTLSFMIVSHN